MRSFDAISNEINGMAALSLQASLSLKAGFIQDMEGLDTLKRQPHPFMLNTARSLPLFDPDACRALLIFRRGRARVFIVQGGMCEDASSRLVNFSLLSVYLGRYRSIGCQCADQFVMSGYSDARRKWAFSGLFAG